MRYILKTFPRCTRGLYHLMEEGGVQKLFNLTFNNMGAMWRKMTIFKKTALQGIQFVQHNIFFSSEIQRKMDIILKKFPRCARGLYHLIEKWGGRFGENWRFSNEKLSVFSRFISKISALRAQPSSSHRKRGGRFGEKCRFSEKEFEFGWPFYINVLSAARVAFIIS